MIFAPAFLACSITLSTSSLLATLCPIVKSVAEGGVTVNLVLTWIILPDKDRIAQAKKINEVFSNIRYPTILAGDLTAKILRYRLRTSNLDYYSPLAARSFFKHQKTPHVPPQILSP